MKASAIAVASAAMPTGYPQSYLQHPTGVDD
jgi:hypothetical protein